MHRFAVGAQVSRPATEEVSTALRKVMNIVFKECKVDFVEGRQYAGEDVRKSLLQLLRVSRYYNFFFKYFDY